MRVSAVVHGFKVGIALSDPKEFQIYSIQMKPTGFVFARRRSAPLRPVWTRTMCPRPTLEVLTCVVVVTAAVLVAINRCGSGMLQLPR